MMRFKIWGIKVNVSFFFVALVTLMLIFDTKGVVIAAFFSALLHEWAHIAAARLLGYMPEEVSLNIIGIRMVGARQLVDYKKEILIALSGPFFNMLLFFALYVLNFFTKSEGLQVFSLTNLALGVFNILPIASLDGGRALHFKLCARYGMETSERIGTIVSVIFLLPIALAGFYLAFRSLHNITLLLTCIYLSFLIVKRIH